MRLRLTRHLSSLALLCSALKRFRSAARGAAAVEFAFVAPVMIFVYLGTTEVSAGITNDRKLTLLSRALADLTGRLTSSANIQTELDNIFKAAAAIMAPFSTTNLQMRISAINVTGAVGARVGRVAWSCAKGAAVTGSTIPKNAAGQTVEQVYPMLALTANQVYTIPAGFEDLDYFVVADTMYPYIPQFGYSWVGRIDLAQTTPWAVRGNSAVPAPSSCPT